MNQTQPLDPADEALLEKVADQIVRRGLTVPAVFLLESSKPMSYVGSQALLFLEPFVRAFLSHESYGRFVRLIEDRDNYEHLIEVIEARDSSYEQEKRTRNREREEESARGRKNAGDIGDVGGESAVPGRFGGWRRWFRRRGER